MAEHMRKKIIAWGAAALVSLGFAVNAAPAYAAPAEFSACTYDGPSREDCEPAYSDGTITWLNRSAQVGGRVFTTPGVNRTVGVHFEAFAGSVKVDTQSRTVNGLDKPNPRGFQFNLDYDQPGGVSRVRVTLCELLSSGSVCGFQHNYFRS
jgi:hypothetical protein